MFKYPILEYNLLQTTDTGTSQVEKVMQVLVEAEAQEIGFYPWIKDSGI